MTFKRSINRADRLKNRRGQMRYIHLVVTPEDRINIKKRQDGDESLKRGNIGQIELLQQLLEVSPKCTKMEDVTQLLRIIRKLEKIENDSAPVLEVPEDEWKWMVTILSHDRYSSYGPQALLPIGKLLEAVTEAKTEHEPHLKAVE